MVSANFRRIVITFNYGCHHRHIPSAVLTGNAAGYMVAADKYFQRLLYILQHRADKFLINTRDKIGLAVVIITVRSFVAAVKM